MELTRVACMILTYAKRRRKSCLVPFGAKRRVRVNMERRFEKKVTTNGTITTHQRFIYRNYLQIAAVNLKGDAPTPDQWFLIWDPTQPVATRPLAIRKDGTWYTYKTADGCKAGWTCVVRHAPVGRGAEGRLRVNWDLTKNICEINVDSQIVKNAQHGDVGGEGKVNPSANEWSLKEMKFSYQGMSY